MPVAVVKIRAAPNYRRDAFENGLQRAGYTLRDRAVPTSKQDFLILWNRKPPDEREASTWEEQGGTVLIAENGYIGRDSEGRQNYALSVHAHNGAGWFPIGTEDRFAALGLTPAPWREEGAHLLICAQRGIGSKTMASPPDWHERTRSSLLRVTTRPIRIRLHPGMAPPPTKLEDDLRGAWACVIWSSGSGVKALLAGVPVFFTAPTWICAGAALKGLDDIEHPVCSDELRLKALQRMSHAQWFVEELASGEPFVRIRDRIEEAPAWN